jgi:hypothetical protein
MNPVTTTIPAAGTQSGVFVQHVHGKYFYLSATNGAVRILTSTGEEYDFSESGSRFGNDNSPAFGKLTFYNDGGTPVTITFYASLTPIQTADVQVQSSVTVNTQLTNTLAGCAAANLVGTLVTAAAANTAYAMAAVSTPFRKLTIQAFKAFGAAGAAPTANLGIVCWGPANNQMPTVMNPGEVWTLEAPTGAKYDLSALYFSAANAGDGLILIYS